MSMAFKDRLEMNGCILNIYLFYLFRITLETALYHFVDINETMLNIVHRQNLSDDEYCIVEDYYCPTAKRNLIG
jgi:hypothetical protein